MIGRLFQYPFQSLTLIQMLKTLEDLLEWSLASCEAFPQDRERIDLTGPIPKKSDLERLGEFGDLPEEYIEVAGKIALLGKEIGPFTLWPSVFGSDSFVESLFAANSAANPHHRFLERWAAYAIACFEAEPIAVVQDGQPNAGAVLKFNLGHPDMPARKIADSFTQFLLIAGSLEMARAAGEGKEVLDAFIQDVASAYNAELAESWRTIGEVVLGC